MNELTRRDIVSGIAATAAAAALPAPILNELVTCVERPTEPLRLIYRWRVAMLLDASWTIIDAGTGPIGPDDLVEAVRGPIL